jgi:Ser/Thr protein kinase RdoA (MazF antagonist)
MPEMRVAALLDGLAAFSRRPGDAALCRALRAAVDAACARRGFTIVHGDAHLENLLVDDSGRVCGLVDLAECGSGFGEMDLAYLQDLPDIADGVCRAYEAVAGPVDDAAYRLAGAIYALTAAVLEESAGDSRSAQESRALLDHCLAAFAAAGGRAL